MGCAAGHPIEPRETLAPGLHRCLTAVPVPHPAPHNELWFDDSAEAAATRQTLATFTAVADPVERLLRAALFLEKAEQPDRTVYPTLSLICPFLHFTPYTWYWEPLQAVLPPGPQAVPWDSAAIGWWFAARAAAWRVPPAFQLVEGRIFQSTAYGWRLTAGSNVRLADGFTDTAFLLTTGQVVRAVAPEERRPGLIATRRTDPTGLNLLALAELGRMIGLAESG